MSSTPIPGKIFHNIALYGGQESLAVLTGVNSAIYSAVRTYLALTQNLHYNCAHSTGEGEDPQSKLRNAVLLKTSILSDSSPRKSIPYVKERFLHMYFNGVLQFQNCATLPQARGMALCKIIAELRQEGKRCEFALPLLEKILKDGHIPGSALAMALHWNTSQSFHGAITNVYEREIALMILRSGHMVNDDGQLYSLVLNFIEARDKVMIKEYLYAVNGWESFGFSRLLIAAENKGDEDIITMFTAHPTAAAEEVKKDGCVIG